MKADGQRRRPKEIRKQAITKARKKGGKVGKKKTDTKAEARKVLGSILRTGDMSPELAQAIEHVREHGLPKSDLLAMAVAQYAEVRRDAEGEKLKAAEGHKLRATLLETIRKISDDIGDPDALGGPSLVIFQFNSTGDRASSPGRLPEMA